MRAIRSIPVCLAVLAVLSSAQAAPTGDGLQLRAEAGSWTSWQTHLSVVTLSPAVPGSLSTVQTLGAARVSSDLFFDLGRVGDGGGLRATGALLLGSRSLALGASNASVQWHSVGTPDTADGLATPYLGLGYTAWWARAGLGFSADLGLVAQRPGQGLRSLTGGSGLDNTVRALQLSPVFQLNLSYAF